MLLLLSFLLLLYSLQSIYISRCKQRLINSPVVLLLSVCQTPMCQREVDRDAHNQVTRVNFFCQPDVPDNSQVAPCMHTRGKEQCQLYMGHIRCKICTYADIDNTPENEFPMSACGCKYLLMLYTIRVGYIYYIYIHFKSSFKSAPQLAFVMCLIE